MSANTCPSARLSGHLFSVEISDTLYNFRVLKLVDSLMVYIGPAERETFTQFAMALPCKDTGNIHATTIMGETRGPSHILAEMLARKLNKPLYLSVNVVGADDRLIRPAVAKRFAEEVRNFPEHF